MPRIRSSRSTRQDEGTKQRELSDQPTPFVGLALSPLIAILVSWLLHFVVVGATVNGRVLLPGSQAALSGIVILLTLGAIGVGYAAWHFSYDRHPVWRYALTWSAYLVAQSMALLVGVGPHRWIDTFFAVIAWIVVAIWALPRLHVLRRDPRENDNTSDGITDLMKELRLTGYKFGDPNIEYGDDGEETRRVYQVRHRIGGTRKNLIDALPHIESVFDAPEGLSRVVKDDRNRSSRSTLTVIRKDPFIGRIPYAGPSRPGGSISDPAHLGKYDDGQDVYVFVAGGWVPDKPLHRDARGNIVGQAIPPTGYAFMGMTRAGKTVGENRLLVDGVITRRDGVLLYLNQAKGTQDVAPIVNGVEVAVLSDDVGAYNMALNQVKNIITYRQRQLGRYGISAWSAEKCFLRPPTHTIDGRPEPMEPMPGLVVHVGEADAILEYAGELAVYIASKGLSVGVIAGWSMQRWAATTMPTDLRFNVGTRFCYGTGDDYSAAFALSETTIEAGAHPEHWRNTKPGRFHVEGAGIDDTLWPTPAKTIGDEDDDALIANMRRDTTEYGPRMARLDSGSVIATRGWWARAAAETLLLRQQLTPPAVSPPDDPAPAARQETPTVPTPTPAFRADPPTDAEDSARMATDEAVRTEIAATTEVNGEQIFGGLIQPDRNADGSTDDSLFDELRGADPGAELPVPPPDGIELDEGKPDAPTRADAELALDAALRALAADPRYLDPTDPTGRASVVRTADIQREYPFRSRPWYSAELRKLAEGERMCPPGIRVERAPDRTGEGWYRLIRTGGDENPAAGNTP